MRRLLAAASAIAVVAVGAVTTNAQAQTIQAQPRAQTAQAGEAQAGAAQAGLARAGLAQPGEARAAEVQAGLAGQGRAAQAAVASRIAWGPCADATLQVHKAQCGMLTVPMDYANPGGPKIQLAVSRIVHTVPASQYQGVMLVNPGGPGGKGRGLAVIGSLVPDGVGADYDWIGFDPRGVGDSRPSLSCDSGYTGYNRPFYVPMTQAIEKTWLKRAADYAAACSRAGGDLLNHLKTQDTARDMDSIRAALGASMINFYGFSYGTYIGQVYASMYPTRVRRMILDGVVDPTRVWYESNLDQDIAFDRNMKIYFGWVAKYDKVYHLGTTEKAVLDKYYSTQADLMAKPAAGVIGPDELVDVFLQAGYYVFEWEDIAQAWSAWVNKNDPAPLRKLFDDNNPQTKGADNGYAVYLGVQCSDVKWPTSWKRWAQDNWAVSKKAPFETWANAWYNAPCRNWPVKAGVPTRITGKGVAPILMLGETLDAATPFSGALETRKLFPRSVLVEGVNGTTHAGSLFGDECVDDTVSAYLATGALPKRAHGNHSDKKCSPLPQPNPMGVASKMAAPADRSALESLIK